MICLFPLNTECTILTEGQTYTIKLDSPKTAGDSLIWKCGDNVVYNRRKEKVSVTADVDTKGSLTLKDISKSNACIYKAEHYNQEGIQVKSKTETLCVYCKYNTVKKINS